MYKHYQALTENELTELSTLWDSVKFFNATAQRRRVGANGPKALSTYAVSKWFDWNHEQREQFRTKFPEPIQNKIIQGWFLEVPQGTGFLDEMTYWVGKKRSGTVIATALQDQTIFLDRKEIAVEKGEQIGFNLQTIHELKPSKDGQLWACVMILGCPMQLTD